MYLKNIQCFIVHGTSFFTDTTAVPKVVNDVICPLCNLLICPQIAHLHVCSNSKQQQTCEPCSETGYLHHSLICDRRTMVESKLLIQFKCGT